MRSEAELLARAKRLGGRRIVEVAEAHGVPLPPSPSRAKGFVGRLTERALGLGETGPVDVMELGVEVKTLPVGAAGRPRESTFVCHASLAAADERWETSRVRHKTARILFVTVRTDVAPGERVFGASWVWSPSCEEEAILRTDWEELTLAIQRGDVERIDARIGRALQLRPKGNDASARTRAYDADGAPFLTQPKAFYLRRGFTQALVEARGLLAPSSATGRA